MPKILSNTPIGEDYLQSESHDKIADTIIDIIQNDCNTEIEDEKLHKKIIGLEGDWGSGKSNIIKILEKKIKTKKLKFHHFLFDTWTHQEDLNRKSLLDELITFLKIKEIIDDSSKDEKYSRLYQKEIKKNTKSNPLYKSYYILWSLSFVIITFGNIIYREKISEKIFKGFYDDSLRYLIENFNFNLVYFFFPNINQINFIYLIKVFPFILILIGLIIFFKDLFLLLRHNDRLDYVFSEIFSLSKGDLNDKLSIEYTQEIENNNRVFKTFLKDEIDKDLVLKEENLIITFDNIDRISEEKVKNIWSIINIFFSEEVDKSKNLKNIWLIVPFDENKIIEVFNNKHEIAKGLLDKTFSFSFRVPPPLTSNWEKNIFERLFKNAFNDVNIDDDEINILTRIFGEYSEKINPRKVINFINDLVTYYHLNNQIKLRYVALFNLNKMKILNEGNINANIISRDYLMSLKGYFESDDLLDVNIAKIVYGVRTDKEANECLLLKDINDILYNLSENKITDYVKVPSFNKNFTTVFNKFVWDISKDDFDLIRISNILLEIELEKFNNSEKLFFNKCWDNLGTQIFNKPTLLIDIFKSNNNEFPKLINDKSLLDNIIYYTTVKNKKDLLNSLINYIDENSNDINRKYNQRDYCDFLSNIKLSLESNSKQKLNDLKFGKKIIDSKLFVEIASKKVLVDDLKIEAQNEQLNNFFSGQDQTFEDITFPRIKNNLGLIKLLNKSKKYDFKSLVSFLVKKINEGKIENIFEFNLFVDVIEELSKNDLLSLDLRNNYDKYISFLNQENVSKIDLYSLLTVNFYKYFSLTNSQMVVNKNLKLLNELDITINEISNTILKYVSISDVIKLPILLNTLNFKKLNEIIRILIEKEKLNDLDFNWIIENYSNVKNIVYNENNQFLLDLFKRKYSKAYINFEKIDIHFIGENSIYDKKLLLASKKYLLDNHKNFEKNIKADTFYLRLLKRLILIDALDETFFNQDFYFALKEVLLNSNLNNLYFGIITKFKKYLNKKDMEKISREALFIKEINNSNHKFVEYIYPEVNNFIDDTLFVNKKQIVNNIIRRLRLQS